MISLKPCSFGLLALATALSLQSAELPPAHADHAPGDRLIELEPRHRSGAGEKDIITFLGVETAPVSATLTEQLQLPNGAGLIVAQVVPDSPAASALKRHDVLLKVDDQLLIDPRQFSVLIRNHADGDTVTLSYVRHGKPATTAVKLVKREIPKPVFFRAEKFRDFPPPFPSHDAAAAASREQTDHVLALVGPGPGKEVRRFKGTRPPGAGFRGTKVDTSNSSMVYTDELGSLELTMKDGAKTLVAKNPKGDQIFSGPATTPEERKALSPELRQRLERIEGMNEFSFETDEAFEDHLKHIPPGRRQIRLPLPDVAPEPVNSVL